MALMHIGGKPSADNAPEREPLLFDSDRLTTHAALLGMTGSGKTGLGVVLLEELLRARIPPIIIDPKGDMTNLLLTFPELDGPSFAPWVDTREAHQKGVEVDVLGERAAARWKKGLSASGLTGDDVAELRATTEFTIYTPGSRAGVPINVLGSLGAPSAETDDEATQDALAGFVAGLLGMIGIDHDPLTSREAILLSNIVHHAWSKQRALTFEQLIGSVLEPPFRKLGVFELEAFYPAAERSKLATRLNGLISSPGFAPWMEGPALDLDAILSTGDKTAAPIFYLAHLDDRERMFFVTLLLGAIITWMRRQSGTSSLRAAVYMDEVFGYLPPSANPPSKKPMLTLLKQARAFGVGTIVSTQNPVDLDYKAMSNASTWFVGRLQTERDQKRVVDAIGDPKLSNVLSGLDKREFVLYSSQSETPITFTSRWAMSYLRGPLTRDDIGRVQASRHEQNRAPETRLSEEGFLARMPTVVKGIPVYHAAPAAEWLDALGGDPRGRHYRAFLGARLRLRFDERAADLDHEVEWEALLPANQPLDLDDAIVVDFDDRDFSAVADGAYEISELSLDERSTFSGFKKDVKDRVYRDEALELYRNRGLSLYSRPEETEEVFRERCRRKADQFADSAAAKLRERFETKRKRLEERLRTAEQKLDEAAQDAKRRKSEEWVSGAGALLDVFLGGRSSTRSILQRASRKANSTVARRSRTRRSQDRVGRAEEKVDRLLEEIEALEDQLVAELEAIESKWDEHVDQAEPVRVRLEKNDVHVLEVAVVWVPFLR